MKLSALPIDEPRVFEIWKLFVIVAGAAVVLGVKLWLIATSGNIVPYWDQWDGEAAVLFKPFLDGTLQFSTLVGPHNEHRILWTRLIALALLKINGTWDPILEMAVNAVIHACTIGILLAMLARVLDAAAVLCMVLFSMLVLSVPFGWENLLWGFQSQFYILILLGFLSLYFLCESAAWSPRWWIGTILAICAYFSIASGALTLPAFISIAIVQFATGQRSGYREWGGLACHCALVAIFVAGIPVLPYHEVLKPHSVRQLYEGIVQAASWPLAADNWSTASRAVGTICIYAPAIVLFLRLLRERTGIGDRRWLLVACAAWVALQIIALALGRSVVIMSSRYLDIFVTATIVNVACLIYLTQSAPLGALRQKTYLLVTTVWIAAMLIGVTQNATDKLPPELSHWRDRRVSQGENLKRFLASGNIEDLANKPIPYPDAARLQSLASDPVIRAILPGELFGIPQRARIKNAILKTGPLLIPIGLAFVILAALVGYRRMRYSAA